MRKKSTLNYGNYSCFRADEKSKGCEPHPRRSRYHKNRGGEGWGADVSVYKYKWCGVVNFIRTQNKDKILVFQMPQFFQAAFAL